MTGEDRPSLFVTHLDGYLSTATARKFLPGNIGENPAYLLSYGFQGIHFEALLVPDEAITIDKIEEISGHAVLSTVKYATELPAGGFVPAAHIL